MFGECKQLGLFLSQNHFYPAWEGLNNPLQNDGIILSLVDSSLSSFTSQLQDSSPSPANSIINNKIILFHPPQDHQPQTKKKIVWKKNPTPLHNHPIHIEIKLSPSKSTPSSYHNQNKQTLISGEKKKQICDLPPNFSPIHSTNFVQNKNKPKTKKSHVFMFIDSKNTIFFTKKILSNNLIASPITTTSDKGVISSHQRRSGLRFFVKKITLSW